ncbi:protein kinase [Sphaerisporangium sp. NPDC051017]|uniref:serine/threonine protein kinase n=1 Tax=Sphaerisporangium sp. NPDC051017 TaxID=3154636 RepID=UPI003423635F
MNHDDRLGPYRLLRRLGEGGMGVVHLALDSQGRQVAVKALRAEVTGDDVARRRLAREVETMRRVRNRYIAEVLDADVTGSRPYIVTRYVPGMPLDDTVKRDGALAVGALLRVAHGVAEALAAVHAAGVIHRDLKPGNVLLLDGDPVLIDFGIAQAVDATRLTQTGMFIGTPGYLAPEIIEGHEAGPEVDVHAWAGTMLYSASGQPPFGKGTLEMIFYNITAGRANVEAAPALLRPLLRAAFHRDPARRPTAAELAAQLSRMVPPRGGQGRASIPDEVITLPEMPPDDQPLTGPPPGTRPVRTGASRTGASPVEPPRTGHSLLPESVTGGPAAPGASVPGAAVPGAAVPGLSVPGASVTGAAGPGRPAGGSADEYVSLLGDVPQGAGPGDPWPTRRVTGEELREVGVEWDTPAVRPRAGDSQPGPVAEGEMPTRFAPPGQSRPWDARPGALDQGEVPTRRVRPEELKEADARSGHHLGTGPATGATGAPARPGTGPYQGPGTGSQPAQGTGSQPAQGTGAQPGRGMAYQPGQGMGSRPQGSPPHGQGSSPHGQGAGTHGQGVAPYGQGTGAHGQGTGAHGQGGPSHGLGMTSSAAQGAPPVRGTGPNPAHGAGASRGLGASPPQGAVPAQGAASGQGAVSGQGAAQGAGQQGRAGGAGGHPYPQALFEQPPDIFERTPHVRRQQGPSYVPTMHLPSDATPDPGAARTPGLHAGSPVYGAASVLALVLVIAAAVLAPVVVTVVVVLGAVLLRAADIAQPAHDAGRPSSGPGVLGVLARPGALLKSIGLTIALVPYALILGVPVALVLAFLVRSLSSSLVLSCGVAVSLWIICAGPGVVGPGRQMNRTLAAVFPSKGAAIAVTCVLGVLAAAAAFYAVTTLIRPSGEAVWSPVEMTEWLKSLSRLRAKAG